MLVCLRRFLRRLIYPQQGSVSVEFAILVPIFLLLVFGIADFGHAWYMKQIITNASREGARYGTRYSTDNSGVPLLPSALSPTISSYITTSYSSLLPGDANLTVTPAGTAYTESNASNLPGEDMSVQVQATKTWWVVGKLLPSLGTSQTLTSTTYMKHE